MAEKKTKKKVKSIKSEMDEAIGYFEAQQFILNSPDLWLRYLLWKEENDLLDYEKARKNLVKLMDRVDK
jgi:hypothetical protein